MQEGMSILRLNEVISQIQDKRCKIYQFLTWNALRLCINGLVKEVNATNIKDTIPKLFSQNLVRGRGLFSRACTRSQMESPGSADVYAALVSVINAKLPEVGALLLRRVILRIQITLMRKDKHQLLAAAKFLAHLVNQHVVHERIAFVLVELLLENSTYDGVEVAVGFVTQCGSKLQDLSPKGLDGVFERLSGILDEGEIDERVQLLIEGLFALRKSGFQGHPAVRPELDLVEWEDQSTHEVSASLLDKMNLEDDLVGFDFDPNFLENEKRYEDLKKTILGDLKHQAHQSEPVEMLASLSLGDDDI